MSSPVFESLATAVEPMKDELLQLGAVGLGIAVALFGVRVGFLIVKDFIKGTNASGFNRDYR